MSFKLTENIIWVGKTDWEIRKFHGEEYSTHRGSTYNSYLIKGEKNVLIDTVWGTFSKEFVENLAKEINLSDIDYVIANHGEPDHSGSLPELMKLIPNTPIYCTANSVKSLKGQYHQDWNFNVVKTGDELDIGGGKHLVFIEAPMLHWPDTMFTYLAGDAVLFSNDAFGQHYANNLMFNDQVDHAELYQEAIKYYANILTPFSKFVGKKIEEIMGFNLPVKMICPSHGIMWRDNPTEIVTQYMKWCKDYQENQITILYDTMWNSTRKMAEAIAEGIHRADDKVNVKIFSTSRGDKNDIITEVFKSKAILVGSPTINRGILSSMAGIIEEIKGLAFKNKKAATFGTYGWSGESPALLTKAIGEAGFNVISDGLKVLWSPDEVALDSCRNFGVSFVEKLQQS